MLLTSLFVLVALFLLAVLIAKLPYEIVVIDNGNLFADEVEVTAEHYVGAQGITQAA